MKKTLVILASILFATIALLGKERHTYDYHASQQTLERKVVDFTLQAKTDRLIVTFDELPTEHITVEVFNLTGKRVERFTVSELELNAKRQEFEFNSLHPSGLYIVKLSYGGKSKAKKFQM